MSRHPLDHQSARMATRPRQFGPGQGDRPSLATRELLRRARLTGTGRMAHFARMARQTERA